MKNMKKALIMAIGGATLLGAASAQAITVNPSLGSYTFSGPAHLTQSIFGLDCDLSLTGNVTQSGDVLTVTVTDGASTGSSLCESVTFGFPWVATIDGSSVGTGSDIPVNVTFQNVDVTGPFGQCGTGNDTVPAVFNTVNPSSLPSSFSFAAAIGNCSVNGNLDDDSGTLQITNP
ncbi:hypothetical protein BN2364_2001 [Alloalcanivorax xenomutans]|uniref:hypothetical protein n=1 Tax=Alloalcanivorax xenomutans TaxID=1094342 RepID=UPI0006D5C529|nr:hypothetical protein [Alloalcanivorax xenomutans]PHS65780.1 MAG: hypothetical protein COB00_10440 [Alcanivorax sp.]CUR46442.1 hypothetical protein BN2364_2001 [Alloalcanivorax xenomutans]